MDKIINLDKPKGLTSQDAVTRVKRVLGVRKAGHAGTLDPIATGVLLVLTGEATKVQPWLMELEKEYVAELKLGERTDTHDAEGAVTARAEGPVEVARERIEAALEGFRGEISQRPPMYSAVKVGGRRLYELARKGMEVERAERRVRVTRIEVIEYALPFVTLAIGCSKGTYIRTIIDDLGQSLGVGAHMTSLRRTRIGPFTADGAAAPDELGAREDAIFTIDSALGRLRGVELGDADHARALNGGAVSAGPYGNFNEHEPLRLKSPGGGLFAIGEARSERIFIVRMLHLGRQT